MTYKTRYANMNAGSVFNSGFTSRVFIFFFAFIVTAFGFHSIFLLRFCPRDILGGRNLISKRLIFRSSSLNIFHNFCRSILRSFERSHLNQPDTNASF